MTTFFVKSSLTYSTEIKETVAFFAQENNIMNEKNTIIFFMDINYFNNLLISLLTFTSGDLASIKRKAASQKGFIPKLV